MNITSLCAGALAGGALVAAIAASGSPQQVQGTRTSGPIAPAGADDAAAFTKLGQLVGSWTVTGVATGADGSVQGQFQGESHFGWTLGGNFLSGDHVLWNGQGAALQMIDEMGFTPGVGFTRSELTNGDRSMFLSSGLYDQAADTIAFLTTNTLLTADGQPRSLATGFAFQSDGSVIWGTVFQANSQPVGSVKLILTRSAAQGTPHSPQAPTGVSPGAPQQNLAQMKSTMSSMIKQRQQLQSQMNQMQEQVRDMSRMMSNGQSQ
ncbi:MAG: hypothetical protein EXS03_06570 [Phycisphaerales bacterium]|nr:hypothetical protein [Phycisphaerales bacterium]